MDGFMRLPRFARNDIMEKAGNDNYLRHCEESQATKQSLGKGVIMRLPRFARNDIVRYVTARSHSSTEARRSNLNLFIVILRETRYNRGDRRISGGGVR
jgi:hypothetical protein